METSLIGQGPKTLVKSWKSIKHTNITKNKVKIQRKPLKNKTKQNNSILILHKMDSGYNSLPRASEITFIGFSLFYQGCRNNYLLIQLIFWNTKALLECPNKRLFCVCYNQSPLYYAMVTPSHTSPSCKSQTCWKIFAKWTGAWLSCGSYRVYVAVTASTSRYFCWNLSCWVLMGWFYV